MLTLNRAAADALREMAADTVHACTDITGFGLLGHATEIAQGSGASVEINAASVPLLDGVIGLVEGHTGNIPGGGRNNASYFGRGIVVDDAVPPSTMQVLFDPQTSGGLLVAVSKNAVQDVEAALARAGVPQAHIGQVLPRQDRAVVVK
jgi:selenide,water dikinase